MSSEQHFYASFKQLLLSVYSNFVAQITVCKLSPGEAMSKMMKENWQLVYQELKPVIEETAEAILSDIADKVFRKYSLEQLFPV